MNAMTDQWTDRLSEYLDDELTPDERAQLEAHLATCRECAGTLDELREVVARAGVADADGRPSPILARHRAASRAIGDGQRCPSAPRTPSRRFSFTMPQLVAAGLALMVMSGGARVGARSTAAARRTLPPVAASAPTTPTPP